ncbi:hypothetical protein EV144_102196 [Flavobacterium sp. 270]|uniref:hypothetical protein n=1 Tax=Flavobacterium sp. 270 TaxID=2512114 RepID=UPI001066FFD1|nr:hypothetical protein [Flavobacterium sp. 270]TDW49773.1 hypothetical protein EV144_102196 [Flavobacterium sp. 270]
MTRIFIGFITCLFLFNCTKKESKKVEQNFQFIISQENEKFLKELKISKIPPPPPGFYGYNQIIIDKNNNFYFYHKESIAWHCVPSDRDTIPDFINLEPKDLIRIPNYSVVDFIKQNVSNQDYRHRMLVIGSQNDTIKNKDFKRILNFLNDQSKSGITIFSVRRSTQQEDTVINYKILNKYYNSDEIKWDKNRIQFPFVKPKL